MGASCDGRWKLAAGSLQLAAGSAARKFFLLRAACCLLKSGAILQHFQSTVVVMRE